MGSEWSTIRFGDLVDFTPKRTIKKGTIAPFISMADVPENTKYIPEVFEKEYRGGGSRFKNGDTVFARITPCLQNGKTAKVTGLKEGQIGHGSTEFLIFSPIDPEFDEEFIYYMSRQLEFRAYAESRMEGSTGRQRVSWQALAEYEFKAPDKGVRRDIGFFLASFDKKIELNRQINQILEQMAQALFKSWFVDFDPVIDNALDAGNPIPDALAERAARRQAARTSDDFQPLPDDVRQLFPSEFEESELGWIPKGWGISRLDSVLELVYGKALKKTEREAGEFPVYGSGGITGTHKEPLVKAPGIIVGRKGTVGSLYWAKKDFYPIDTVFYVRPKAEYSLSYCFYLLKSLGLENMNTDAAVPGLNRNNAYRLLLALPPIDVLKHFSSILEGGRNKMDICSDENNILTKLRDTLLPKLISGELRLDSAEVEQAKSLLDGE